MAPIKLSNGLWFDHQAEEAAKFYTSIFRDSKMGDIIYYGKAGREIHGQKEGTVMVASFTVGGLEFVGINGGPLFKMNPSISYFVVCETEEETLELWARLSEKGEVLMPLDRYDWSEKYGWVQDRYGLSWQVSLGKIADVGQKVAPCLMFTGQQHGKAEEALRFYTSVFEDSNVTGILKYEKGETEPEGTVKHAQFTLSGQTFMVMDSAGPHAFQFNEAISMIVSCRNQEEIDYYWNKLTEGGTPGPCGWLKDRFGVSWQVEPVQLREMLKDADKEKVESVTEAYLRMQKFDIAALEKAFNGPQPARAV